MNNKELYEIFKLFYDEEPVSFNTINTSHGNEDFRETIIVTLSSNEKKIIKLADNDFTFSDKIKIWQKAVIEYRKLGYYCPLIMADKTGGFPKVNYKEHNCVVYSEEYAPYQSAETMNLDEKTKDDYKKEMWEMSAKIASQYYSFSSYPSGYCLFETFCPSDKTDEVLENALAWKEYTQTLPNELQPHVKRIWELWINNRKKLEPIYKLLPTSVFQADLNSSNILLDDKGKFVGVYDFNLCGREVFMNYILRENFHQDFQIELKEIFTVLEIVSKYYKFSETEKESILMLYRCLKPLWFTKIEHLQSLENDINAQRAYLDEIEKALTMEIDFSQYMN